MEWIATLAYANKFYLAILILPFFSGMIYDWFQKDMVLSIYGDWLNKERGKILTFIKKPLGACLKCMHVWVCIIWFLCFCDLNVLKFLPLLGVSYYILVKSYFE